jgi:hypothetical protein
MLEMALGSDETPFELASGLASITSKKASGIVSAYGRYISRRFPSIRSRWETKIHVDRSMPGAYRTTSGDDFFKNEDELYKSKTGGEKEQQHELGAEGLILATSYSNEQRGHSS